MRARNVFAVCVMLAVCASTAIAETLTLRPMAATTIFGQTDAGDSEARLLLDFDLTVVPRDAAITDVNLCFDSVSIQELPGSICLYAAQVMTDWDSQSADWSGPGGDADWEQPGGDWIYDFGDYGCLSMDSESESRLNLTTLIFRALQTPEEFNGLILFPMEYPDNSLNLQLEILRTIQTALEIEYYLDTDVGGSKQPDQPVAD
jgi:hypothetical protein